MPTLNNKSCMSCLEPISSSLEFDSADEFVNSFSLIFSASCIISLALLMRALRSWKASCKFCPALSHDSCSIRNIPETPTTGIRIAMSSAGAAPSAMGAALAGAAAGVISQVLARIASSSLPKKTSTSALQVTTMATTSDRAGGMEIWRRMRWCCDEEDEDEEEKRERRGLWLCLRCGG